MNLQKKMSVSMIAALVLTLGSLSASAETVQIPVGQQGQDKQNLARPRAGMDQNQVKAQFGNPLQWTNPVGDPPITKWVYKDFIVVFEYDHVIHSVLVPTPQQGNDNDSSEPASDSGSLSAISKISN